MILVGVDGGATKTSAIAYTCDGRLVGRETCRCPSNYKAIGVESAIRNISQVVNAATRGSLPDVVCLGLAGVDSPYDHEVMGRAARSLGREVHIDNDAFMALYAETKGGPGVLTVAGTGSITMGYDGKNRYRYGGLGWMLGDVGSAYWVGSRALQMLGNALDGTARRTRLTNALSEKLGIRSVEELLRWAYVERHAYNVDEIASLAVLVDEVAASDDAAAIGILRRGARGLARHAIMMAKKIGANKVHLVGGMFRSATYLGFFRKYLNLAGIDGEPARRGPEHGALMFAFKAANCPLPPEFS